ncbi:hypothetical protein UA08_07052 [Talaromyces atroroseus]|uniref:Inositol polyphosphate-related phosphatase domain-containing protein n=1 Tax=Talaromyces atroroseus TaxID=1441469 RepID=A0A225A9P8_TALAT|nr:hypothetical protein UA08_07052 [Talaromyces atroroseus]OKL57492.1 hypothetical protein UA08_07052 [Talaromyces atroroseus]
MSYTGDQQECLNAYIVTFNCARNLIPQDHFAAHFFDVLPQSRPAPEILVLSLQEVAPISYAFLGGSFLVPYLSAFQKAIDVATANRWPASATTNDERQGGAGDIKYVNVISHNCGFTALLVFVRADVAGNVAWADIAEVGVGIQDMGNKGAVGARLGYMTAAAASSDDTLDLTFVAAHIAPMEHAYERRNRDWRRIVEGLVFTKPGSGQAIEDEDEEDGDTTHLLSQAQGDSAQSGIFSPRSHLFFAGDLNYRTSDTSPAVTDRVRFPQPNAATNYVNHHSELFKKDQLTRELRAKKTLHGLSEAPITFPPTYKYSDEAQKAASQVGAEGEGVQEHPGVWKWAKKRWPSWCDRILYLDLPSWMATRFESEGSSILVYGYNALPLFPTSDHRPVALSVSVPLRPISPPPMHVAGSDDIRLQPPFAIDSAWRIRRASARIKEIAVGGAVYLVMTWEGNGLLLATVVGIFGGWVVLRSLLQGELNTPEIGYYCRSGPK